MKSTIISSQVGGGSGGEGIIQVQFFVHIAAVTDELLEQESSIS